MAAHSKMKDKTARLKDYMKLFQPRNGFLPAHRVSCTNFVALINQESNEGCQVSLKSILIYCYIVLKIINENMLNTYGTSFIYTERYWFLYIMLCNNVWYYAINRTVSQKGVNLVMYF